MIIILEVLVSSIRVLLMFYGAIFTYLLGEQLYRSINNALFTYSIPCMELLSFIIATAAPIAYFYGIYHKTAIFSREKQANIVVLLTSFLFGAIVTFLPITGFSLQTPFCSEQINFVSKILHSLITGLLTAFIAFLSLDFGVFQALYLTPMLRKATLSKKKKK